MAIGRLIGQVRYAPISLTASGVLVDGAAGSKIRVLSLFLNASASLDAKFVSGSGSPQSDLSGLVHVGAGVPFPLPFNEMGWFETADGADLVLDISEASVGVGGGLSYVLVPGP